MREGRASCIDRPGRVRWLHLPRGCARNGWQASAGRDERLCSRYRRKSGSNERGLLRPGVRDRLVPAGGTTPADGTALAGEHLLHGDRFGRGCAARGLATTGATGTGCGVAVTRAVPPRLIPHRCRHLLVVVRALPVPVFSRFCARYGGRGPRPADARHGQCLEQATEWWPIEGVRSVARVRLPSVPGPSDVLAAMGGVRSGVADALDLVPRIGSLLGRVDEVVDRISAVLTRVEEIVDRADAEIEAVGRTRKQADDAIAGVGDTQRKADDAITAVGDTQRKADDAITGVGDTRQKADDAITGVERTAARADSLLDHFEPALTALSPAVRRLAATLDAHEVEAMVALIDQLPRMVTHLDEDILPILGSLGDVGTDVRDLVDTVQDMRQVVKGFPGSKLFRRRGAEEIAQAEADGDASS
jgi:archaellum component FlaC